LLLVASALTLLAVSTLVGCSSANGSYMSPTAPSPTPPASGDPVVADLTIRIVGMAGSLSYSPNPATVNVGQKVAWYNADSIAHTATSDAAGFNTGTLAPGATSAAITMSAAGAFGYHCAIHGSAMTGTLNVIVPGSSGY
jgi:plastocyanin